MAFGSFDEGGSGQPMAEITQTSGEAPRILPSEPKPTTAPVSAPKAEAG